MMKNIITSVVLFVLLVFLQAICNRICLFNIAVPFVYIYFIMRLPMTMSVNWVMILSFVLGLIIDIFSNTAGMNAMACTILAATRKPVFSLFYPREDELSDTIPSIKSLGVANYTKYMSLLTLIFCLCIYIIQMFTFYNIALTILRIIGSTLLTALVIFGFDCIATTKNEKRL